MNSINSRPSALPCRDLRCFSLLAAGALIPSLVLLVVVNQFAVDIPIWDDYDIFLKYLNNTGGARWAVAFIPHNEHRVVFERFCAELQYQATGQINFRQLAIFGNLALFVILLNHAYLYFRKELPWLLFLPIPLLLLNFVQWHNTVWATGSLQHNYVLCFALLSLTLSGSKRSSLYLLSLLLAALAALTSGSGFFLFFIIIGALILDGRSAATESGVRNLRIAQTSWKRVILAICVMACTLTVCFVNFEIKDTRASVGFVQLMSESSAIISYFFAFLGSYLQVFRASLIGGAGTVVVVVYLAFQGGLFRNPPLCRFLLFIVFSALAVTYHRYQLGADQAMSSRYTVYSTQVLIVLYILLVGVIAKGNIIQSRHLKAAAGFMFILALGFYAYSISIGVPKLMEIHGKLVNGMAVWQSGGGTGLYHDPTQYTRIEGILRESIRLGRYSPPDRPPASP